MFFGSPPPPPVRAAALPPIESAYIFAAIAAALVALYAAQTRRPDGQPGQFLPPPKTEKREYEVWVLKYSVVWMGAFAVIIALQLYEAFDAAGYFFVCGGLALPLWVQALRAWPVAAHALRAQLWVAVFGFIGNYWYTHYFYSVLRAKYTMPSWRLNDVPIAMYFATHFYFCSYHVFANLALRKLRTRYAPCAARAALFVALVLAMAYAVAFMETLTISHFPYYDFEDRDMAYTVGSAFYGIYFIVSFPVYFALDEATWRSPLAAGPSLVEVALSSLGSGMAVLLMLDLVRLGVVGAPLTIGGKLFEVTG
jgi:cycloeucalenol cycloisomerase